MTRSSPSSSPHSSSSPGDAAEHAPAAASPGDPGSAEPSSDGARAEPRSQGPGSPDAAPPLLDLCGELCPFTFVRTKLALEELPIGARLRVIVDHEPATRNIPRSAAEWGQDVIGVTRVSARTWAIDLRKRVR